MLLLSANRSCGCSESSLRQEGLYRCKHCPLVPAAALPGSASPHYRAAQLISAAAACTLLSRRRQRQRPGRHVLILLHGL